MTVPPLERDPADLDPELVLAEAPFVRALARELVFDRELSRDLEQEVLLAALSNGPRDPRSLRGWLATVVRHLAAKLVRSRARRTERERAVARPEDLVPTPAEILAREDLRRQVLGHLLALEEPLRSALILRFVEELPPREVARRLALPVETARTRIKRGLAALRERLRRDERLRVAGATRDERAGDGRAQGAWCLALVKGLKLEAPSVFGAAAKLFGGALVGVLAVSSLKKSLVAALVLVALGTWTVLRLTEAPLSPPGDGLVAAERAPASLPLPPDPASVEAGDRRAEPTAEPTPVAPSAAAPAANGRASLELVLRWHDGTPAAGVGARVHSSGAADFHADALTLITGADGVALAEDLAPGRISAYLDRGSYGECRAGPGERGRIEIQLERGFDLAGVVEERGGRPIAGARLFCDTMGNGWLALPAAVTDGEGRFRIRSIRPGVCWVSVRAPHRPPSPQYEFLGGAVDIENLRLLVDPLGGAVAGTVFGPDGEPLRGAEVLLGEERAHDSQFLEGGQQARVAAAQVARVDEDGRFRFEGTPLGRVAVQARGPGAAPWMGEVDVAPGIETPLAIRMRAGARLSGRVLAADGTPIARAEVSSGPYGFASRVTRTDAEGRYRLLDVHVGAFTAGVEADRFEATSADLVGASGVELEWNPVLSAGLSIRGRLSAAGVDFSKWWIYCESTNPKLAPFSASTTPTADGSFEFRGCADGEHALRIHMAGASIFPIATLVARPGPELLIVPIDTARLPSARVRGRLVDDAGAPMSGVRFNLFATGLNFGPAETVDADGRFDLGPLPPGGYTVFVRTPGYCTLRSPTAEVAANAIWDFGELVLARGGTILVQVPEGCELERERAGFDVRREGQLVDWFNLDGRAGRSNSLDPGEYELRAWIAQREAPFPGSPLRVVVRAGEETRLEIPAH